MDAEDLTRFGELLQALRERRELDVAELYDAGWLLGEVARYAAALTDHMRTQVQTLPSRYILRDDEGRATDERIEDAAYHLAAMASEYRSADSRARLYHSQMGHIAVEVNPDPSDD